MNVVFYKAKVRFSKVQVAPCRSEHSKLVQKIFVPHQKVNKLRTVAASCTFPKFIKNIIKFLFCSVVSAFRICYRINAICKSNKSDVIFVRRILNLKRFRITFFVIPEFMMTKNKIPVNFKIWNSLYDFTAQQRMCLYPAVFLVSNFSEMKVDERRISKFSDVVQKRARFYKTEHIHLVFFNVLYRLNLSGNKEQIRALFYKTIETYAHNTAHHSYMIRR